MQINRLFEIIYILLNKSTVTAKYLADYFEVSTRTIYRDVEVLSGAGIPIYMSKGKGGGIRLMEHFVLNKSVLSDKDQQEILSALQGINAINPSSNLVLSKLSNLFQKSNQSWIEVDLSDWSGTNDIWLQLKNAILNHTIITFHYFSSYGEKTLRTVKPLKLSFKERSWYLKAYCTQKNTVRTFKLSRIKNLIVTEDSFEPFQPSFIEPVATESERTTITLVMKIDASQSFRVYDEFYEENIQKNSDGSFTITATFADNEWVYGYILSFGCYATVLEPLFVRQIIKEKLEKCLTLY